MSIARRIEELEELAYRQGFDALSNRMAERLRHKSEVELAAIRILLERYAATGEETPGLLEIIKELTQP